MWVLSHVRSLHVGLGISTLRWTVHFVVADSPNSSTGGKRDVWCDISGHIYGIHLWVKINF